MWPTYESCEIHSMGLEFIAFPFMDRFFGEDAERFCRQHIIKALMFIPYGVAVDHFQHMVYERPDATAAERHEMWKECERTYLPHRDYGDLGRLTAGGLWQRQLHIYMAPFYYIDYTLAQTCALQLYLRSKDDFDETVSDYVALCRRGGEAPFQELARSAGLKSPLEQGCLRSVVDRISADLA
jgi:M3 family oligoendopeptidase